MAAKGYDTRDAVLAGYGGAGFDDDLRAGGDVLAVDLERLYGRGGVTSTASG